jgi:hypothetical protein
MSKKIGFFSNINTSNSQPAVVPVFTITAQLSNVAFPDVPDTITFDIDSTLAPPANTIPVYWSTSGASNADFTDNVISGNVLLDASGNATVVRQITLVDTGSDGNVTFTFRTGDPAIGNVIHTQTVDLSSERFATFTRYIGNNVSPSTGLDKTLLYYNQFANTNNQGELIYSDNAVRLELLPGDKLEITAIQTPTSNTEITDVEILSVNQGGTSGYFGIDVNDVGNVSIGSQGGGPGGHVVHATNQTLVANTYVVVDRIYQSNLTAYGKTETGLGNEFTVLDNVNGMGLVDTGVVQVYNSAQLANATGSVGDFAILLNTTAYPYKNTMRRYNGSSWVSPTPGQQVIDARRALANALVVSRAWSPDASSSGTDDFLGGGADYYGSGVPAEGGGGPTGTATQTTSLAPIVNNVLQTAFDSGTGSATHNGAGGAGQGGNGSDPDATAGGDGGAGYVSDIRGFGNVQYGAGGAGANGSNVGVTYSATNFRKWNTVTEEFETVTAYPPGTGQVGVGTTLTRATFNEYTGDSGDDDLIANQGRIYLKWRDFRRFLTL